ncbi:hypothetical protein PISMIDRAFT_588924 [Pisolithus microcarpus 441]|uniref:LIM zinc-binding domain-containing protein n=1 Tax=Pisolithus microcarpus 441 TaxID=765257 RepID=A0A0C9ZRA3_9AGAM|nr:hypothetical protein PISMIDRAFT_588924 [Pisolithus microcarpus 441]
MGFCRRCGDIVLGLRCKCGGTAVAPVIQWSSSRGQTIDKWSQTYVSREKSPTRPLLQSTSVSSAPIGLSNDEPNSPPQNKRTAPYRSVIAGPSSRKPTAPPPSSSSVDLDSKCDISGSGPNEPDLLKAYGSVLQPKESLTTFACVICAVEFQPDATIYPDPCSPDSAARFLCQPCFVVNGGSKGDCTACGRPVLILKGEGGFVEASNNVWHKRCFRCNGCQKDIGDTPVVDLLGQPTCADCFGGNFRRNSTPRRSTGSPGFERSQRKLSSASQVGVTSQQGSPGAGKLELRSGVVKRREDSPALEELTQKLNGLLNRTGEDSPTPTACRSHKSPNASHDSSPLMPRLQERNKFDSPSYLSLRGSDNSAIKTEQFDSTPTRPVRRRFGTPDEKDNVSSGRFSLDAVEEMKRRFMNQSDSVSSTTNPSHSPKSTRSSLTPSRIPRISSLANDSHALRHIASTSSLQSARLSWTPSTPDLVPDMSDTMTQSSAPSSPPAFSPRIRSNDDYEVGSKDITTITHVLRHRPNLVGTETPIQKESLRRLSIPAATLSPGSLCAKCGGSLFASGGTGRFVTVPELNANGPAKTYHTECFRCVICDGPFKELPNGKAVFVRSEGGSCHLECAPPEQVHADSTILSSPIKSALTELPAGAPLAPVTNTILTSTGAALSGKPQAQERGSPTVHNSPSVSSRYERPPSSTPTAPTQNARFGNSTACPGCLKAVSLMEFGVVPGPQGFRWHASCLVCGGKKTNKMRRDKSQPGCGKRLDSAAKRDADGGVWCRECLLLLPTRMRQPIEEKPLVMSFTGRSTGGCPSAKSVTPQLTGSTTIARQFTGMRSADAAMMRQLTGGGLSPTRQLAGSPTKQLGLATPRPRPKSVIGVRSGKSVDEGRGMFLVRQMTGGGALGV